MSSFDERKLIDHTLPELAMTLAKHVVPIGEGTDWRTPQQSSWRSQADLTRPFFRIVEGGGGKYTYIYCPYRKPGATVYKWKAGGKHHVQPRDPQIARECQIKFYNLRVTDVIDRRYGRLDKANIGPAEVSTRSYPNDGPGEQTLDLGTGKKQWIEWSSSWEVEVASEIEQTIKAGSELYGIESETKIKISASASTGGEKSGGEEQDSSEQRHTKINPYSILDVVTTRQPVEVSQDIVVTGQLECSVDIVLIECWGEANATLEQLFNVFRGLGAGNDRLREWFSDPTHTVPEEDLQAIKRPTVTLNIGLKGIPAESFEQATHERPIGSKK